MLRRHGVEIVLSGAQFALSVRLRAKIATPPCTLLHRHRSANRTLEFQRRIMRVHPNYLQRCWEQLISAFDHENHIAHLW